MLRGLLITFCLVLFSACSSSEIEDALDLIDGVERKSIDTSRMGLNAFGNKNQFGTACEQYVEVVSSLRLNYLRILINWNNDIQPTAGSAPDFSFYDHLMSCIPDGADALLVVNGLPGWMLDSANWQDGNSRITFVNLWFKKVFQRYASNPRVVAFQVWNEPNMEANSENSVLEMTNNPENYLEMLAAAYSLAKGINGSKIILNAATTTIAQNFPSSLDYNKKLQELGAENFVDRWAIHYYGEQFERVIMDDGVADFLNSLSRSIWITESGRQGVNNQLAYVETVWPFLREKVGGIDRIYYYQYASLTSADAAFGLRNPSTDFSVSDLFVFLRDR